MTSGLNNNCDLPQHLYGFLRQEFCNNLDGQHPGVVPCVIFGIEALPSQALGFHVLREDGAMVAQVPIHGLCHEPDAPQMGLEDLEAWDCFGYWVTAIEFSYLKGLEVSYRHGQQEEIGIYVCTIDFLGNGFSGHPSQHKNFHLIKIIEGPGKGNFALQPNNRCRWKDKSFTENLFDWSQPPAIQTNEMVWHCENQA